MTTPRLTKQEAVKALVEKIEAIGAAVKEAEEFADDYSLPFSLNGIDLYTEDEARENWDGSSC